MVIERVIPWRVLRNDMHIGVVCMVHIPTCHKRRVEYIEYGSQINVMGYLRHITLPALTINTHTK